MQIIKQTNKGLDYKSVKAKFTAMIKTRSGVLYVQGKPGIGKTAIFKQIAVENKWNLIDIRLAQIDETEVGGLPIHITITTTEGKKVEVMDYALPRYLVEANDKPTLIVYDELNRAPLTVRNAALKILMERQVGTDWQLNDNVFMVALGNLGEEDGCEVEEFDQALNGRLIHYKYDLTIGDWKKNFAQPDSKNSRATINKVHPLVVSFIDTKPNLFYSNPNVANSGDSLDCNAYASPRTWTFLSDFIVSVYGMDSSASEIKGLVTEVAFSYVGTASKKFMTYLDDMSLVNIQDIIKDWKGVKKQVQKFTRDRQYELADELKKIKIKQLDKHGIVNVSSFLKILDEDKQVAYLNYLLDDSTQINVADIKKSEKLKDFLRPFKGIFNKIDALSR